MKNNRVLLIFFIITTITSAMFGVLSNLIADIFPNSLKPYILPGFIISLLALIGFGVWQFWVEHPPHLTLPPEKPTLKDTNSLHQEVPLLEAKDRQLAAMFAGANAIYGDVAKALSTAETAKRKAYEKKYLAESITAYVKQLESFI